MNIWTIILAAGAGSRFGGPKALADWNGQTLLERAISCVPDHSNVVVVTGAHKIKIPEPCKNLLNPQWEEGMGTSIAAGLSYVESEGADIAVIVPVDQPFVTRGHLGRLIVSSLETNKCTLSQDKDIHGPPAAIPKKYFESLKLLKNKGLKSVLSDYALCQDDGVLLDIDTPEDLEEIRAAYREAGK